MATKPGASFTWSTDLNFLSGPASGFPTKVPIPSAAQGLIPGDDLIPEYLNNLFNFLSTWIDWGFDGSSAGAADAHVVETDSSGDTHVQLLFADAGIEVTDAVNFQNTTGTALISRTNHSGTGALDGNLTTISPQDGQTQVGATDNNDAGLLSLLDAARPGEGGSGEDGGIALVRIASTAIVTSSGSFDAWYRGFVAFDVPGSGVVRVRLPQRWFTNTLVWITLTGVIQSSAKADVLIQKSKWRVDVDGVGDLVVTQPITNPEYEQDTGFTAQPNMVIIDNGGPGPEFLDLQVAENDGTAIRCGIAIEIIVCPSFP